GNPNYKDDNVPSILKPRLVSRKFILNLSRNAAFLQFGSGESITSNVAANPQDVAMNLYGKDYVVDTSFDPTKLLKNQNFGISPSNTTLTVTYRANNSISENISTGAITKVKNARFNFTNEQRLSVT
ncbi:MAG TPA: hypothetical protein DCM40_06835, partial [Maribacter sp.]|nr:hypothetical protein [Maribacter sp.]